MKSFSVIRKVIFGFSLISISFCTNFPEMNATFRGDSPLYFNKTSIEMAESQVQTITLNLQNKPADNVTIDLAISDIAQAEIDPPQLVFTPSNYNIPQTINILGKDDCKADGTANLTLDITNITSTDSKYSAANKTSIPVTVKDGVDNLPKIVFYQSTNMTTSEIGTIAFFKVNLSCAPQTGTTVVVPLSTDKPSEVAIDKASLTFTATDFSTYQTVTVTGLSDCIADPDQTYHVSSGNVSSADTRFFRYSTAAGSSEIHSSVTGTNLNYPVNNDLIISTPPGSLDMTLNYTGLPGTPHPDPFISFSASLTCPPPSPVYFSLEFTDSTGAFSIPDGFATTVNTSLGNTFFSFNSTNWSTPQNVLIQLSNTATGANPIAGTNSAFFINPLLYPSGTYPAGVFFTDNTKIKIRVYQSDGSTANTAIVSPSYLPKTLNANMTIKY